MTQTHTRPGSDKTDSTVIIQQASRGYSYFISFVAAIGGFLFGYDLVIISGAQIFLKDFFRLSAGQWGFATSCAVLGCIFGPCLGAFLSDRLGRKATLAIAGLLFIVGAIGTSVANTIGIFYIFRIVGGVGVGLASLASPMYIAEVAPAAMRGRLGIMYQLAITVGCVMAGLASWWLALKIPDSSLNWRWMFASIIPPVVGFLILLLRVPQSPRWLAERNKDEQTLAILCRISGREAAEKEMVGIKASLQQEVGSFRELLAPGLRFALFVGIMLALFNNWTGMTGTAWYFPTLFQEAGYAKASDAIAVNLVPSAANVLFTFFAIWMVDRGGRRPLWIGGSAAMCVLLIFMGLMFHWAVKGPMIVLMALLMYAPHAVALGPLPWLMMSEIFPTRIRARAVSVSTTFLWIAGFTGPLAFPWLAEISKKHIGSPAAVFWMYSVICVFAFVFGLKWLPETKGRTLEQIAKSWERRG